MIAGAALSPAGGWAWLLTLTVGAERLYWSSTPVDGFTVGGRTRTLEQGLAADAMREIVRLSGGDSRDGVAVEVWWPEGVSAASLDAAGVQIPGSPAEVALLPLEAPAWEGRAVMFRGYVADAQLGGAGEPCALTLEPDELLDRAWVPSQRARVSAVTWPDAVVGAGLLNPDADGVSYPRVYGSPGDLEGEAVPATPCVVISRDEVPGGRDRARLVLATIGHSAATTIPLWYRDGDDVRRVTTGPVIHTRDALGVPVTLVDLSGIASSSAREAMRYNAAWTEGAALEAGTLGAVARELLELSGVAVDAARTAAAVEQLDAHAVGGFIAEPIRATAWVADRCSAYPAALDRGPGGVHLLCTRWNATAADAVAALVEGDGTVVRDERIRAAVGGRTRAVIARWGWDAEREEWLRRTYIGPDPRLDVVTADGTRAPTSVELDGPDDDRTTTVDLIDCWSSVSAYLVARWVLWRDGRAVREVAVRLAAERWGWLQRGDVVTYTDAACGWAAVPCLVVAVGRSDEPWIPITLTPTSAGR